ncbi:lipoyl(octanoyl) transferase LipB [Pontibacter arcticus]|uniref:Octanoyltransferase n=1 Tax=Pontibacter arcticus TaxID=2080288 RepID=A0A364RJB4_9BACT|nr:lipoyl(octanoyl) transferase LipB [Pontibacter arcticus]RAU84397.1 lipoyl(octanoyl) transferase [Pontibacter arcticus]
MEQNRKIQFEHLGLIDYKEAWDYQEKLFKSILDLKAHNRTAAPEAQQATPNYLLFCYHPHVYTLGKSGHEENLLLNESGLEAKGATYYKINRGGDITYHGPGQIVGYPILDLESFFTDIHKYLRFLEEAVILTLKEYNIEAGRIAGLTGVWLDHEAQINPRKICAMGVKCSRWVTMHGFAFNVNTDLDYFNNIVPCGISDKQVTSLAKELGHEVSLSEVEEKLRKHLAALFEATITDTLHEERY